MAKQYYRICKGLSDKGKLVPTDYDIYKHVTSLNKDHYISLYKYNEEHKKTFDETGTVSGITDTSTDKLLWDFDDESDFEAVRSDSLELITRLQKKGFPIEDIDIYFSGNKGTHIIVALEEDINESKFKAITKDLAKGLKSYDSTVSNASRIIRVPFTKHQKSGLYKTPLSYDELKEWSEGDIKHTASEEYDPELKILNTYPVPEVQKLVEAQKQPSEVLTQELDLDYADKPKWLSHWKYALLNGYFPDGTKHTVCMVLAATFKSQGFPIEVAYRMIKGAMELQMNRFQGEEFVKEDIYGRVKDVYKPTWQNGTYAEDSFPQKLKNYLEDLGVPRQDETVLADQQIELVSEGFAEFVKYAEDIDKYTMKFGIKSLDEKLKARKGHLIGFIAPPGVGKTSLAVSILNNMSKKGTHGYFGSFDMYKHNVYQKLIQRHAKISEKELFDVFKTKNMTKIGRWQKMLEENYGNVSFCFKVGQTVEDLKSSIRLQEQKVGKPIDLVVIDYLELVLTKASDPTAASAEAVQGLREIANEGRVVLILLQPNKMSSKPNQPLTSFNAAKGSSSIAQACTAVLTAHRPGLSSEHPEDDNFFGINCVKNRNGPLFALDFAWKGSTQTISELSDVERLTLKDLRDALKVEETLNKGF